MSTRGRWPADDGGGAEARTHLWRAVFEAADRALELGPGEQRAFVARFLEEQPAVGVELAALMDGAAAPSALETPASTFGALFLVAAVYDEPPMPDDEVELPAFGPYRVRRELGSGGMGAVYLAERADDQYRKHVALKVLPRWSGGDRRRLQRFLDERQMLATLDHPGIARLLDGGVTADGLPWFAMEYIDGEHIDRYCDTRRLSIEARLALFCDVCAAVQYAHRNLIVHRDLKPSNILVAADGRVALVDFGIAKLVAEQRATSNGAATTGDRMLTPLYSSPEQIRGEPVSTAADVYALGVLLYALLTGTNPYRLATFDGYAVARAVLEQEPERPSTSVTRTGSSIKLTRRLRGDLDAIVLNAMAKDPGRRYATVQQFESDVRRHLTGLPVLARPESRLYHMTKFLRRHRVGASITALAASLIVAFAAVMTVQRSRIRAQAERITVERDRAERVSQRFLNIFRSATPGMRGVEPREILDSAAARIDEELSGQPEQRARLIIGMADAYHGLDLNDRAGDLLERALILRRALRPAATTDIAATLDRLGSVRLAQGRLARADSAYGEALALRRRAQGAHHAEVARTLVGLSVVRRTEGRFGEAEQLAREAVAIDESRGPAAHADLARSTNALAAAVAQAGDPRAATVLFRRALALERATHPETHPDVIATVLDLAAALHGAGEQRAADSLIRYGLGLSRRLAAAAVVRGAAGAPVDADASHRVNTTLRRAFAEPPTTVARSTGVADTRSRIVFVSDRDGPDAAGNLGNHEIYVMNADGSGQRRLTHDPGMDSSPVISPDGRQIAFTSTRGGGADLFVMNADGSDQRQLTHLAALGIEVVSPTWSPDGTRIAFHGRGTQAAIHAINVDGAGLVTLHEDPLGIATPAWSPDGRHIAYTSRRNGRAEIFVMDADGGNPTRLTFNEAADSRPAWSPDSKRIAFQSNRDGDLEIYAMNADGSDQVRLTSSPGEDAFPSWSPDGRRIVFHRVVLGHGQVHVMNDDGSGVKRLTDLSPVAFSSFPCWGPAPR